LSDVVVCRKKYETDRARVHEVCVSLHAVLMNVSGRRIGLPFLSIHEWLFPFQDVCESGQPHASPKGMVPVGNQATTVPLMLWKNSWVLLSFLFLVFLSCKTSSTRFPACCVAWILGHTSLRAPGHTS
jgi:hypothetical protein